MYVPAPFREERLPALHEAMRQAGLATLVTHGPDGLVASHVPLHLEPTEGPYGTLYGHLARANGQWREASADVDALALFTGPDAYVSPSSYATKALTGKAVPTWNYVAVHAYGPLRLIEDPERLLALVTRQTEQHEAAEPHPWSVRDAPEDYVRGLLRGIVGFELRIRRLEGKWKLSQNRSPEDRAGVIHALERSERPGAHAVATAMRGLTTADD